MRDKPIVVDNRSAGLERTHVPESIKRLDEDDRFDGALRHVPALTVP